MVPRLKASFLKDVFLFRKEEFYGKPFHNHEISAIFILEKNIEPEGMCLQKEEVSGVLWMDFAECLDGIRKNTLCHCILDGNSI